MKDHRVPVRRNHDSARDHGRFRRGAFKGQHGGKSVAPAMRMCQALRNKISLGGDLRRNFRSRGAEIICEFGLVAVADFCAYRI